MKCPVCKLENLTNSESCSCGGYNFKYCRLEESAEGTQVKKKGKRIALAFLFSVVSFFLMFILGEIFGAWAMFVGMGAYFIVSQYLLSRGNPQAARNDWLILIALNSLLGCSAVLSLAIEPNKEAALQTLWLAILCLACSYAGAALASLRARNVRKTKDRETFRAVSPASFRRLLMASAAVVAAVAIVLVVGVIPLTARAGTFPDGTPGSSVPVFWGIVGLNALVAACLGFFGFRVRRDDRAPSGALAFLALLAFMSACFLAPAAFAFRGHGPVLLTVSKLALLCMVAEIVVTAFVGSTALRLSEARQ